jgi:dolichyl-diphosphooligosaccharide--protein glycosyltransferase
MNPTRTPEYGILAKWSIGSWIENIAQRPTVATNFGSEIYGLDASAQFALSENERDAVAILKRNKVRYVIVTNEIANLKDYSKIIGRESSDYARLVQNRYGETLWSPGSAYYKLVSTGLLLTDGLKLSNIRLPLLRLRHFRLLYESENKINAKGLPIPVKEVKVFEYVEGARIIGYSHPNETVSISLILRSNQGRIIPYSDEVTAKSDGRFEFIVPYPTVTKKNTTSALSTYIISTRDRTFSVDISEEMLNGSTIALKSSEKSESTLE